jgi:thiol-disulfide isomerase/thioredoxin
LIGEIELKGNIARLFAPLVISALILGSSGARVLAQDLPKIPYEATAITLDGETVSLEVYKGKLVFLTVWRTDCKACMFEIPILNKLQKEYANQDFTIIGLSMDKDKDDLVRKVIEARDINYPIWLGYDQPLSEYTQTQYLPTLFAIGPEGEVLGYLIGAFQSYEHAVGALTQSRSLIEGKRGVE